MDQLSVLPVSFFSLLSSGEMTEEQWAKMGKKYGLSYVDFPNWAFRNHMPSYLRQQKYLLDTIGIRVGSIGTHSDLTNPDSVQRKRELDYLRYDIALASEMGAGYVRVTDGQAHPGLELEQGLDYISEGLSRAAETAKDYSVILGVENHGFPSAWIYDDFSHDMRVFRKLMARLDQIGVGINFDSANATGCGIDAAGFLEEIYDRVVSVHIADTISDRTTVHTALGAGICPIKDVLKVLYDHAFTGLISIEEDSKNGEAGVFQAVEHVRGIWNSFPSSNSSGIGAHTCMNTEQKAKGRRKK